MYSELPLIQPHLGQKKVAGIMRWLDLRDTSLIQQHSKEIKLAGIGRKMAWSLTHYACVYQVLITCIYMYYSTITLMSITKKILEDWVLIILDT